MKKIPIYLICFLVLNACIEEEHIAVPPQLKIIVTSITGNIVPGASISLYGSENDYKEDLNLIITKQTDEDGAYIFKDLDEVIYYFNVEKGQQNNQFDITFFKAPLQNGERKIIHTVIK